MNTSNELPSTKEPTTSAEPNVDSEKISSPIKKNQKEQFIGKRQKLMIINLYKAKKQRQPDIKYKELMASISHDSGIGMHTSPHKTKIRPTVNDKIDDFNKNAIKQKIYGFWFRNEIPTLKKIVQAINDDSLLPNLPCTSLRRVLKELNFEFTKRSRNSTLTERADRVVWRQKYIEDIRHKTWVNAGETCSKVWIDKTIKSRLIVAHIGSTDGFVDGGLLCFESKKNTSDYNDEMNGDTFYDWFCGVLPRLKDNSVIVMNNASYHSVKKDPVLTNAWKKEDIKKWLNELNPIELAWSVVKNHVKQNNTTFKLNDVKILLNEGVQKVTSEIWANFVSHTIKEEDKLYDIDIVSDRMMNDDDHILTITGDTSSDFSGE
ncbi:hypothetical protein QTP88_021412 [Uroleucon formosanum]